MAQLWQTNFKVGLVFWGKVNQVNEAFLDGNWSPFVYEENGLSIYVVDGEEHKAQYELIC